jgi:broad specificity phosphatase PhoE
VTIFRTTIALLIAFMFAESAAAQRAIILVRHAEKETDPAGLKGVADKDVPISEVGKERAKALAEHLKDAGIDAIYTSFAKRTQLTAEPLAKALQIKPAVLGRDFIKRLGERHKDDVVLIVAHSGGALGVPQLIDEITGKKNDVVIDDREFDRLFVLIPKKGGTWGIVRSKYGK